MRHYGLPLASRFTAWKAFVLPHILFFLPFVLALDIPELQSMINSSLRDISDDRASPEALCAEIGLLPVKWLWAQTLAINGGRLQSNSAPLRAAEIVTNLLSDPKSNDYKGLGKDYKIALFRLGFKTHWPLIQARELLTPQSDADKAMLEHPQYWATELAPYRNTWNLHVKARAKACAELEHSKWLDQTGHRAHAYKLETLSSLKPLPKVYSKASWLTLPLSTPIQQRLLQRRTMATDLDTHTPSSRRAKEDYEESFCPICLRAQASQDSEHTETMVHFLWECEHLHPEQKALDETLATFVQSSGGIPIAVMRQWKDLPQGVQLGLLMGNYIPDINTLSNKYEVIQQWLTRFLEAADAPLLTLWKKRAKLVVQYFPEWKVLDIDPTAVNRHVPLD
jgi:hypothetical protein